MLSSGRIIPVQPILTSKIKPVLKKSDEFYYPAITDNKKNMKKRISEINIYRFKIEAFERFKYEISQYLQTKEGLKVKVQSRTTSCQAVD